MRIEFRLHNLFRESIQTYLNNDPHLRNLKEVKFVFRSPLENSIPLHIPGIYILTGGRQVGKSTLIKLLIRNLLTRKRVNSSQIYYIPCDLLERYQELVSVMEEFFEGIDKEKGFYLFLDEMTYVKEWDRAIKYFADLGYFTKGSVLITGSDSVVLKEAMKKFPGRRGKAENTDFHYYPLSFSEFLLLTTPKLESIVKKIKGFSSFLKIPTDELFLSLKESLTTETIKKIDICFKDYLLTGGFLPAINEFYKNKGKIGRFVYRTYQQWIIGDILKRNKKEHFLKEILVVLSERLGKQITLHNIASMTEIQHHSTIQDYLNILQDMDVLFIQQALREDKLKPAPKKAKKIHFTDPFIAQSLISWAKDIDNPTEIVSDYGQAEIVEGCIVSLFRRNHKVYYIKAEGEVDLVILSGKRFLPVEIKWTENLKRSELKQILKYRKGIISYKGLRLGKYEHLYVLPVPLLALFV
ncbi:ATP-binding protein [bacterium]|nr:ATP-binding protein [bacterium]